ncbi:MAG: hypothetical protein Q9186_005792 [Xanthomendoza sp. 1 TL-2023]
MVTFPQSELVLTTKGPQLTTLKRMHNTVTILFPSLAAFPKASLLQTIVQSFRDKQRPIVVLTPSTEDARTAIRARQLALRSIKEEIEEQKPVEETTRTMTTNNDVPAHPLHPGAQKLEGGPSGSVGTNDDNFLGREGDATTEEGCYIDQTGLQTSALSIQNPTNESSKDVDLTQGSDATAYGMTDLPGEVIRQSVQPGRGLWTTVQIEILGQNGQIWQRGAALDTQSSHNLIKRSLASDIGLQTEVYQGLPIRPFGHVFHPEAQVALHWNVSGLQQPYRTSFLILKDEDCQHLRTDIILSRKQMRDDIQEYDIHIFPRNARGYVFIQAKADRSMPVSIVSTPVLTRLQRKFMLCQAIQIQDARGQTYVPIGKINLEWRLWDDAKSFPETFYVVESDVSMVMLGSSAFHEDFVEEEDENDFYPIGTAYPPHAKSELEQKRAIKAAEIAAQVEWQRKNDQVQLQLRNSGKCPTCGRDWPT